MSEAVIVEVEDEVGGGKKKLLLAIALVLVLTLAAGWWLFLKPAEADDAPPADGEIVTLDPLTTTVGVDSPSHARVGMALVLVEGVAPEVVEPKRPLLQDALLRQLANTRGADLRSSEGSDALRKAMTAEARAIWGEDIVRRVVLTELLVQ
jgi:flagellar basal body-associated protein FliL